MAPKVRGQRSKGKRQRRFLIRLAISLETLLRLKLGYQVRSEIGHSLPVRPSRVINILKLLVSGIPLDDIVSDSDTEAEPEKPPGSYD